MFFIGLIKRMKSLLTDNTCLFWTCLLHVILALAFCLAIPSSSYMEFRTVNVSIADSGKSEIGLYISMRQMKNSSGKPLFHVTYSSRVVAEEKLKTGEIDAYITRDTEYTVYSAENNANTSLVEVYLKYYEMKGIKGNLQFQSRYLKPEFKKRAFNKNEIYYLSLIAMASFCAMYWGVRIVNDMKVNQSGIARRIKLSPVSTTVIMIQNMCNLVLIELAINILILLIGHYLNHMNFDGKLLQILGIQMLTSVVGIWCGILFGVASNLKYEEKIIWCHRITFLSSFLGGIMVYRIRYKVDTNLPLLGKISPVNVAADALFHVYFVKSDYDFIVDVGILFIMCVVTGLIQIRIIRRRRNERI